MSEIDDLMYRLDEVIDLGQRAIKTVRRLRAGADRLEHQAELYLEEANQISAKLRRLANDGHIDNASERNGGSNNGGARQEHSSQTSEPPTRGTYNL